MIRVNYKILWQQLARHLINKKPFKHRDELKMDHRFLEIYQQFVDKYGGWIDPYEFRVKPKKKEKKFEYY